MLVNSSGKVSGENEMRMYDFPGENMLQIKIQKELPIVFALNPDRWISYWVDINVVWVVAAVRSHVMSMFV